MSYSFGPSGGSGGNPFSALPPADNGPWKISAIQVWSGNRIDAIEMIWRNPQGNIRTSPKFGGSGGTEQEFDIDAADYLVRIEGSVGEREDNVRVFSLQFFTKQGRSSKVFGSQTAAPFRYDEIPGNQVISLFGRSGAEIDALGVVIEPIE